MVAASERTEAKGTSFFNGSLEECDPEIFAAVRDDLGRQQEKIELIASENIVSRAVLEAQGSVLTNKYAEGYPGRRYYGGCEFVDVAETLAIGAAVAEELYGVRVSVVVLASEAYDAILDGQPVDVDQWLTAIH